MNIEDRLDKIEWQVAHATSGTMNEEDRINLAGIIENEVPALTSALRMVLKEHSPVPKSSGEVCETCDPWGAYPCWTIRAIETAFKECK